VLQTQRAEEKYKEIEEQRARRTRRDTEADRAQADTQAAEFAVLQSQFSIY
jgi:hypothetical protein